MGVSHYDTYDRWGVEALRLKINSNCSGLPESKHLGQFHDSDRVAKLSSHNRVEMSGFFSLVRSLKFQAKMQMPFSDGEEQETTHSGKKMKKRKKRKFSLVMSQQDWNQTKNRSKRQQETVLLYWICIIDCQVVEQIEIGNFFKPLWLLMEQCWLRTALPHGHSGSL